MFQQAALIDDKNYKVASESESSLKTIILVLFTTAAAAFTGYFIIHPNWVYGLISFALFLILFVLQTIFIKSWPRSVVAFFIESFAIVIIMALNLEDSDRPYIIYVWAMLLFSFGTSLYFTINKMGNSVRIPFWKITRAVSIKVMTGITLVALATYIFIMGPASPQFRGAEKVVSDYVVAPAVRYFAPDLPKSEYLTVDEIVTAVVMKSLQSQMSQLDAMPPADKERVIAETIAKTKELMNQRLGEVDYSASPMLAVYKLTASVIAALNPFGQTVAIVIVIFSLWLIIKTFMLVLFIPFALVLFLVYETLIVAGFVTIEYEARSAEVVVMK